MARKPDIIFLETRRQRIKRRWQGMSRIGRLGVISIIFGGIGFLTCWLFTILPYVSVPFSLIGLCVGISATVWGFVNNEKLFGFWLPLMGLVLSAVGLAIAAMNYSEGLSKQQKQEFRNSPAGQLIGVWELEGASDPTFLSFAENGNAVLTQMTNIGEPGVGDEGRPVDKLAQFNAERMLLTLSFRTGQDRFGTCDFQHQIIKKSRLVIEDMDSSCREFDLRGSWNLISTTVPEGQQADSELEQYQEKLKELKREQTRIELSRDEFNDQKDSILKKLQPYEDGTEERDDAWEVHAQDLKIIVDQIQVIERRLPKLDAAIVRLESAIGNRIRQAQMDKLGLSDEQLRELLRIRIEIDDELQSKADAGADDIGELELRRIIDEQFQKFIQERDSNQDN